MCMLSCLLVRLSVCLLKCWQFSVCLKSNLDRLFTAAFLIYFFLWDSLSLCKLSKVRVIDSKRKMEKVKSEKSGMGFWRVAMWLRALRNSSEWGELGRSKNGQAAQALSQPHRSTFFTSTLHREKRGGIPERRAATKCKQLEKPRKQSEKKKQRWRNENQENLAVCVESPFLLLTHFSHVFVAEGFPLTVTLLHMLHMSLMFGHVPSVVTCEQWDLMKWDVWQPIM